MGSGSMASSNRMRKAGSRRDAAAYYETYVDGNTVRKIEAVPERTKSRRVQYHNRAVKRVEETREKALKVNIGYVLFLALATGLLLVGCVRYLQIQASVTATMKSINAKESELSDLKAENDAEYNRVMSSVDLESIRKTAMEELGMVYASEDQVVLYDSKSTDYVRQYQDVPKNSEDESVKSKAAALFGK